MARAFNYHCRCVPADKLTHADTLRHAALDPSNSDKLEVIITITITVGRNIKKAYYYYYYFPDFYCYYYFYIYYYCWTKETQHKQITK